MSARPKHESPPVRLVVGSAALVVGSLFMAIWGGLILNGVVAAPPLDTCNVSSTNGTCVAKGYSLRGASSPSYRYIPIVLGVSTLLDGGYCPIVHQAQFDSPDECWAALMDLMGEFGDAATVPCYGPDTTWIDTTWIEPQHGYSGVACTMSPKPSARAPRFMHSHILIWGGIFALVCSCGIALCVRVSY